MHEKYFLNDCQVIPMMNPDGVIVGNYRTSLSARDLNRNYRHPKQEAFPTVWHTKQMVEKLHQKYPVFYSNNCNFQ